MIYIIWGNPGEGKTYLATYYACQLLKSKKNKLKIFSNFPIIYTYPLNPIQKLANIYRQYKKLPLIKPKQISTMKWNKEYVYQNVNDSVIFIDEAYLDFSSTEMQKNFDADLHSFIATNRHNNIDIYFIAQHYNRILLKIREIVNVYYVVRKWINPFTKNPLFFRVSGYLSEEDYKMRFRYPEYRYSLQTLLFSSGVAKSYDTHHFRKPENINPSYWLDDIKKDK